MALGETDALKPPLVSPKPSPPPNFTLFQKSEGAEVFCAEQFNAKTIRNNPKKVLFGIL